MKNEGKVVFDKNLMNFLFFISGISDVIFNVCGRKEMCCHPQQNCHFSDT